MLWGLAHLESAFFCFINQHIALQRFERCQAWYADSYVNHLVPNILQCPLRYATVQLYTLSQLPERKFGRRYFKLRIVKRKRKTFLCVVYNIHSCPQAVQPYLTQIQNTAFQCSKTNINKYFWQANRHESTHFPNNNKKAIAVNFERYVSPVTR